MYIVDNSNATHLDAMKKLFEGANEIFICVAFIKESGVREILDNIKKALNNGSKLTFFAGLDFYLTEPNALKTIYALSKQYRTANLYLCEERGVTFHPKLYFSIFDKKASLLIGSANLTNGGLIKNNELSIFHEVETSSEIVKEVRRFLSTVENQKGTQKASTLNISQYRKKYNLYNKRLSKAQKDAKKEISTAFQLDLTALDKYLKEYRDDENEQKEWRRKVRNYREAKKVLGKMTSANISSRKEFLDYYERLVGAAGQGSLWHSGSLFRLRNKVASKYKTFLQMAKAIQNNTEKSPIDQFGEGMKYVKKVKGLGVNVLTEILNTYSPRKCSVLNNNPISSLHYLGFEKFKAPNTFREDDYEKYNDLMKEFAKSCEFRNLSQVDHFLNYVYWKYVKRKGSVP
jgi:HKD family nuclease